MSRTALPAAAAALLLGAAAAEAHATFENREAAIGSTVRFVLRIPHGCEGEATLRVRVRIPEGIIAVKPMPKAGWTLETVKGPYAKGYAYFGSTLTEGVQEIVWSGELPDEHYDEFIFRGRVTDALEPGKVLHFPAVQDCATRSERWIEIPAEGQEADALEYPAPGILILPAAAKGH